MFVFSWGLSQKKYKNKYNRAYRLQFYRNYEKKRIISIVAAGCFALATLAFGIEQSGVVHRITEAISEKMKLKYVEIREEGASNLSHIVDKNFLIKSAKIPFGQKMLSIDLSAMESDLRKIKWIKNLHIRKWFPSTIVINYETPQARAMLIKNGKPILLDSDGNEILTLEDYAQILAQRNQMFTPAAVNEAVVVSAVKKSQMSNFDLPVVIYSKNHSADVEISDLMEWLDALENIGGQHLVVVHQLSAESWGGVRCLIEVFEDSNVSHKINVVGWKKPSKISIKRLNAVINETARRRLLITEIDLRPAKKVVVLPAS